MRERNLGVEEWPAPMEQGRDIQGVQEMVQDGLQGSGQALLAL